jgi:hypothetical protein
MMDLKLLFMYTRVFRPRLILTIVVALLVQVFVYSAIVHFIWEANPQWTAALPSAAP